MTGARLVLFYSNIFFFTLDWQFSYVEGLCGPNLAPPKFVPSLTWQHIKITSLYHKLLKLKKSTTKNSICGLWGPLRPKCGPKKIASPLTHITWQHIKITHLYHKLLKLKKSKTKMAFAAFWGPLRPKFSSTEICTSTFVFLVQRAFIWYTARPDRISPSMGTDTHTHRVTDRRHRHEYNSPSHIPFYYYRNIKRDGLMRTKGERRGGGGRRRKK